MGVLALSACADADVVNEAVDEPVDQPVDQPVDAPALTADEADVAQLLRGDGSEYETGDVALAVVDVDVELEGSDDVRALATDATGGCCADGDCVCRGEEPSDATGDGPGPFATSSISSGFRDGPDFGGATIFFPTNAEPPLSGVVMCPGFTAKRTSIAEWGPFLASHGIVLMTIDTNSSFDSVRRRDDALLDALESLKAENTRAGSPLQGMLSEDRFGLAGWSMGGGGTWIAAAATPALKSAVTLAGHSFTAGGARIAAGSTVPTLLMNGALDHTLLGGLGQSRGAFDAIPDTTPKLLYEMANEGHFSWGTPRTNNNASGRYMLAWQKVFLEDDARYLKFLLEEGPDAATFISNLAP